MKKRLFTILLASTLIMPFVATATEVQESTIHVEYTINNEMAPDTVKIKFYIENSGINLNEIKQKNDKIANAAINEIKKKLNNNENIKTIAFRVNNIYSYKDKIRVFQKYEVVNGFEVKLKDMEKISEIIKLAMDNGVKRIDNPVFSIENGQAACNELMAQAIKSAKQRASVLAAAADSGISKPKSINPYCSLNTSFVQPRYYANSSLKSATMDAASAEGAAMDVIEPGSITVRAGVNMTYYLK